MTVRTKKDKNGEDQFRCRHCPWIGHKSAAEAREGPLVKAWTAYFCPTCHHAVIPVMLTDRQVKCDSCDWTGREDEGVLPIPDLVQRLDPGGTVPACECPVCGALAYLNTKIPRRVLVVLDMYGDTLQTVYTDAEDLEVETVVLENEKYAGASECAEKVTGETEAFTESFVVAHHVASTLGWDDRLAIMSAANRRIKASRKEERHGDQPGQPNRTVDTPAR